MIPVLERAARTARKASTGERVVDIVLTEQGFIVRARSTVKGQQVRASNELSFSDFGHRPDLLVNAVVVVTREIEAAERRAS